MIYEFVDCFNGIKIGDKIKIKESCIPPCRFPVFSGFVNYIQKFENLFTVRTIQEIDDDNAMIGVEETNGSLEFYQIEKLIESKRVINSGN